MLIIAPPKFRKRREWKKAATVAPPVPPPPVVGPVLLTAEYLPEDCGIMLGFDRDINPMAMVGSKITVNDPIYEHSMLTGVGILQTIGGAKFEVSLVPSGAATGTDVRLTAAAGNGIVDYNTGEEWAGVSDVVVVVLP